MTATTFAPDLSPTARVATDAAHARTLHARILDQLDSLEQAIAELSSTTWGPADNGACPAPDGTSAQILKALDRIRGSVAICEPIKDLADPSAAVQRTAAWGA